MLSPVWPELFAMLWFIRRTIWDMLRFEYLRLPL